MSQGPDNPTSYTIQQVRTRPVDVGELVGFLRGMMLAWLDTVSISAGLEAVLSSPLFT